MTVRDILGCLGGAWLLLTSFLWLPVAGPFVSLLTPLPFSIYATKLGMGKGAQLAAAMVLSALAVGRVAGRMHLFVFALQFTFLGLVLAYLFRRAMGIGKTTALATALVLATSCGFLLYASLTHHTDPTTLLMSYLEGQLRETLRLYQETGMGGQGMAEVEAFGRGLMRIVARIYPSLMILGTGIAVWVNVIIARSILRKVGLPFPDFAPADRWRAPEALVWVLIPCGFSMFMVEGTLKWMALNAVIVVMTVYAFQGLSIVLFLLNKYHVPAWGRILVYSILAIQQVALFLLALGGLFDQWIDLRRLGKEPPQGRHREV